MQLMAAANAAVPKIAPTQAQEMIAKGNVLVLDVRDAPELEKSGKISWAMHHSRGMLEFHADPELPYFDKNFAKDKTIIVYYASGRAVLAGKALKDMGYGQVYNLGRSRSGSRTVARLKSRSTWECRLSPPNMIVQADVGFWPKADIGSCTAHVGFRV